MIQFSELRIVGGKLMVEAFVDDTNVTIDTIKIDNQKTYSIGGPSASSYTVPSGKITKTESNKRARTELLQSDIEGSGLTLDSDLLFVYIIPVATPPTELTEDYGVGVVANFARVYNRGITFIKELANTCEIPYGFADFILKFKAFILSVKAQDFQQAIKFWNKFFGVNNTVTRGCRCNGSCGI